MFVSTIPRVIIEDQNITVRCEIESVKPADHIKIILLYRSHEFVGADPVKTPSNNGITTSVVQEFQVLFSW